MRVYNRKRYLRQAVLSILDEKIDGLELILVDDGSTDGSLETVKDLPLKLVCLPENRGPSAAQNVGLQKARGQYIGFFDSDDLLVTGGLRWRLDWLLENESLAVAGALADVIDEENVPVLSYQPILVEPFRKTPPILDSSYFEMGYVFDFPIPLTLVHHTLIQKVGLFDEGLVWGEDLDFFYRLIRVAKAIPYFDKPVLLWRQHSLNISGTKVDGLWKQSRLSFASCYLVNLSHGMGWRGGASFAACGGFEAKRVKRPSFQ